MTLATLPKEQKQYLVLGLLVTVVLVVLSAFGIKISLSSIAQAKAELQEIAGKIDTADRSLAKGKATGERYLQTASELRQMLANVPPSRNYYSWATEIIYSQARSAELEIEAIDELAFARTDTGKKDKAAADAVRLESYALRISAHGGYRNLKGFLFLMETEHPMARIIGIDINSGSRPDVQDIQLLVQWPFNTEAIAKTWEAVAEKHLAIDATGSGGEVDPMTGTSAAKNDNEDAHGKPAKMPGTMTADGGSKNGMPPNSINEPLMEETHANP